MLCPPALRMIINVKKFYFYLFFLNFIYFCCRYHEITSIMFNFIFIIMCVRVGLHSYDSLMSFFTDITYEILNVAGYASVYFDDVFQQICYSNWSYSLLD